jgi:hypothetical protein
MMMINQPQLELQRDATTTLYMTIDNPKTVDVLCGRGKMCFRHEGNGCFRMLIAKHADTYKMAPNKRGKTHLVALVVDIIIARGGRFLIQNKDCTWFDAGREQGKKKTGQSFQDAMRGRVKYFSAMRELNAQALQNDSDDSSHSSAYDKSEEFDLNNSDWRAISRMNLDISRMNPSINARALRNVSDDSSHSSAYDRSEEFDLNNSDKWLDISWMNPSILEPYKDWMHIKVDKEIANDLLKFFMAEQRDEAVVADKCGRVMKSVVVYHSSI